MTDERLQVAAELREMLDGRVALAATSGHGIQSRVFEFSWRNESLEIDYRIPVARVLSSEETQASDAALLSAALRLAILLLETWEGDRLSIHCDETGVGYTLYGQEIDSGDDWEPLIRRLEASANDASNPVSVIWP